MDSLRRWLNKPKVDDKSLLARFYHADKALTAVANELDSFDGRSEPERCSRLVSKLRQEQDRVLGIINLIMDELLGEDRACRAFRAKFPEEVLQESLAGQLWFGAECLSAGSAILNREVESAEMRPLAKAVTKSLDNVRNLLRDQCLRNNTPNSPVLKLDFHDQSTENLYESLKIFDRLFSDFELQYVSAMVQVKTKQEHETQELISVLFSEALQRALLQGILHQDQVDSYDPSLMFSIPRLAIIAGLIIYDQGPLNLDLPSDQLSEMFRPFRKLLVKMRDYLKTLNKQELYQLEMLLCTNEEINLLNPPDAPQYDDFKSKLNEKVKDERVHKINMNKNEWVNEDTDVADDEADEENDRINENPATTDCSTGFLVSNTNLGNLLQTNGTTLTYNIIPRTDQDDIVSGENNAEITDQRDSGIGTGDKGSLDQTPEEENSKVLTGNYDENWENLRRTVEPSTSTIHRTSSSSHGSRSCKEKISKKRSRKQGYHYNQNHHRHQISSDTSSASPSSSNSSSSSPASTGSSDLKDLTRKTKFRSTENLLHRLFVCIAGVADQLQTNFASDLRQILRAVFLINCSQENDEPETVAKKNSIDNQDLFEFRAREENVIRQECSTQDSIGSQQSICSAEEANPESDDAVFEEEEEEITQTRDDNALDDRLTRHGNRYNGRSISLSDDSTASFNPPRNIIDSFPRRTVSSSVSTSCPQSPPKWLPDHVVMKCMSCDSQFTAFRRRHHCRNCGGIFCSTCSSSQTPLPRFGLTKPVRVCKQCYIQEIASSATSATQHTA